MIEKIAGLVLAGGESSRMGTAKAALILDGQTLVERTRGSLAPSCGKVFISLRAGQGCTGLSAGGREDADAGAKFPVLLDIFGKGGPAAALLAAYAYDAECTWFVLACDFPYADAKSAAFLLRHHHGETSSLFEPVPESSVTCFRHADGTPEPLFALWRPPALARLQSNFARGITGPIQTLKRMHPLLVPPENPRWLFNVNTPEQWRQVVPTDSF